MKQSHRERPLLESNARVRVLTSQLKHLPDTHDESHHYQVYRMLTHALVAFILIGCIVGILVPAGIGWDFANFYDAGRRVTAVQANDLYHAEREIAGQPPQGGLGFWGAPISAWLYAPLSYFSPQGAMIVFKIQNTVMYVGALILLYHHTRQFVEPSSIAAAKFGATFAFLSLIYQPFWTVFRVGGQTTPTVFLLLVLALLAHTKGSFLASATCLVMVVLIKPAFIYLVAFLGLVSGVRFLTWLLTTLVVAGVVSLLLMGWNIHEEFLDLMRHGVSKVYPWFSNSSLYVTINNLRLHVGGQPTTNLDFALIALGYAIKSVVAATFIYILATSRGLQWSVPARRHFQFLVGIAFFLLISQTVWEHYLSALFLLLIYIVASRRHFGQEATALVAAIFVLSVGQNLIFTKFIYDNYSIDSIMELILMGLFKSGPLLLTWILLWRHHNELFQSYAADAWHGGLAMQSASKQVSLT